MRETFEIFHITFCFKIRFGFYCNKPLDKINNITSLSGYSKLMTIFQKHILFSLLLQQMFMAIYKSPLVYHCINHNDRLHLPVFSHFSKISFFGTKKCLFLAILIFPLKFWNLLLFVFTIPLQFFQNRKQHVSKSNI